MKTNSPFRSLRLGVLLALLATLSASALATEAVSAPLPAEPQQVLQQVLTRLSAAKTLETSFTYTETSPVPLRDLRLQGKALASKPGNWRLEIARFRRTDNTAPWAASGNNTLSVSDGETSNFEFIHPFSTQHRQSPLQAGATAEALSELGPLRVFFDEAGGWPWRGGGQPVFLEQQDTPGDGQRIIQIPLGASPEDSKSYARVVVGPDHLLRDILVQKQGQEGLSSQEWNFDTVVLDKPVDATAFEYRAKPGARPFAVSRRSATGPTVGSQAPDFTVRDRAGKLLRLSDLKGKTVVLDFWASWCWVCNQSFPSTAALARKYAAQDVVVLAVAIQDSDEGLQAWLKRHSYPEIRYAIDSLPEGEDIASHLYGVKARPNIFIIDNTGKITSRLQGFDGKSNELEEGIVAALQK